MREIIQIDEVPIMYDLIICKRKTLGIKISADHGVEVRVPRGIPKKLIDEILKSRATWIMEKLNNVNRVAELKPDYKFIQGEKIPYRGKMYQLYLHIVASKRREKIWIVPATGELHMNITQTSHEYIRENLISWYKKQAKLIFTAKSKYYAQRMDLSFQNIRITSPTTRWGSCTSAGNINYNWKIILAPDEISDYLVIHELCHLKEMNHSPRFYQLVSSQMPNYDEHEEWLRKNGVFLSI